MLGSQVVAFVDRGVLRLSAIHDATDRLPPRAARHGLLLSRPPLCICLLTDLPLLVLCRPRPSFQHRAHQEYTVQVLPHRSVYRLRAHRVVLCQQLRKPHTHPRYHLQFRQHLYFSDCPSSSPSACPPNTSTHLYRVSSRLLAHRSEGCPRNIIRSIPTLLHYNTGFGASPSRHLDDNAYACSSVDLLPLFNTIHNLHLNEAGLSILTLLGAPPLTSLAAVEALGTQHLGKPCVQRLKFDGDRYTADTALVHVPGLPAFSMDFGHLN